MAKHAHNKEIQLKSAVKAEYCKLKEQRPKNLGLSQSIQQLEKALVDWNSISSNALPEAIGSKTSDSPLKEQTRKLLLQLKEQLAELNNS